MHLENFTAKREQEKRKRLEKKSFGNTGDRRRETGEGESRELRTGFCQE